MDTSMTLAKRLLWNQYTAGIHNEPILSAITVFNMWKGSLKHFIKSNLWKINSLKLQSTSGWDLDGSWASFTEDWEINDLAF
jgi:hypothetical protein